MYTLWVKFDKTLYTQRVYIKITNLLFIKNLQKENEQKIFF